MKAAVLCAIATGAAAFKPVGQFYWKRDNATMINGSAVGTGTAMGIVTGLSATAPLSAGVAAGLTTLVITATQVETITTCQSTVVPCPASAGGLSSLPPDALSTYLVTSQIVITTTVCPVSEAPQISSAIMSAISSADVGVPTGSEITTSKPFSTIDATTTEGTTTTTMTTQATSTITVTRVPSSPAGGNGSPGDCVPVTVTVTQPPETVYVTVLINTPFPGNPIAPSVPVVVEPMLPPSGPAPSGPAAGIEPSAAPSGPGGWEPGFVPIIPVVPSSSPVASEPPAGFVPIMPPMSSGVSGPPVAPVSPPPEEDDDDEEEGNPTPGSAPNPTSDVIIDVTATVVPYPVNDTKAPFPAHLAAHRRFGRRFTPNHV